jgi:ABC-type glycerol-3-phosphate transport system substrate-binding protein
MRWGIAPLPRDKQAATLALVAGYAIARHTAHPEESWAWVSFLSEQMPPRSAPARPALVESEAYEEQVGAATAAAVRATLADSVLLYPRQDQTLALFVRAVVEVLSGQATAEEALARAQEMSPLR